MVASDSPSPRRGRWAHARSWLVDLVLIAAVFGAVRCWRASDLVEEGTIAPELALASLDGTPASLSAAQGRPVMVHFWATWCSVCRREFGALNAVAATHPGQVLTVVDDGDDAEAVRRFARDHGLAYPILLGDETTTQRWRISVFPTTYYLDTDGRVAHVHTGMGTRWGMRARLWWIGRRA